MSDYCREKVLRIPITEDAEKAILEKYKIDDIYDLEFVDELKGIFDYGAPNHFSIAPTVSLFLDYILESTYDEDCGDWGKTRALTDTERNKYACKFLDIYENFDINNIRLVEYCWYNCTEAPDYYDQKDPFYDEV